MGDTSHIWTKFAKEISKNNFKNQGNWYIENKMWKSCILDLYGDELYLQTKAPVAKRSKKSESEVEESSEYESEDESPSEDEDSSDVSINDVPIIYKID